MLCLTFTLTARVKSHSLHWFKPSCLTYSADKNVSVTENLALSACRTKVNEHFPTTEIPTE